MRFFSKIVFICNICFLAAVLLRLMEEDYASTGHNESIIPLPALEGLLVILGLIVAVLLNFVFAVTCLIFWIMKKQHNVAKWLVWINLLLLIFQLIYFKLY